MKDIITKINESINKSNIDQLEQISCDMFKEYDSTYDLDELADWVEGKEDPSVSDYEDFIDDILAYCDENKVKLQLKTSLEKFRDLNKEDQDEIQIAILRGMAIRVAEDK